MNSKKNETKKTLRKSKDPTETIYIPEFSKITYPISRERFARDNFQKSLSGSIIVSKSQDKTAPDPKDINHWEFSYTRANYDVNILIKELIFILEFCDEGTLYNYIYFRYSILQKELSKSYLCKGLSVLSVVLYLLDIYKNNTMSSRRNFPCNSDSKFILNYKKNIKSIPFIHQKLTGLLNTDLSKDQQHSIIFAENIGKYNYEKTNEKHMSYHNYIDRINQKNFCKSTTINKEKTLILIDSIEMQQSNDVTKFILGGPYRDIKPTKEVSTIHVNSKVNIKENSEFNESNNEYRKHIISIFSDATHEYFVNPEVYRVMRYLTPFTADIASKDIPTKNPKQYSQYLEKNKSKYTELLEKAAGFGNVDYMKRYQERCANNIIKGQLASYDIDPFLDKTLFVDPNMEELFVLKDSEVQQRMTLGETVKKLKSSINNPVSEEDQKLYKSFQKYRNYVKGTARYDLVVDTVAYPKHVWDLLILDLTTAVRNGTSEFSQLELVLIKNSLMLIPRKTESIIYLLKEAIAYSRINVTSNTAINTRKNVSSYDDKFYTDLFKSSQVLVQLAYYITQCNNISKELLPIKNLKKSQIQKNLGSLKEYNQVKTKTKLPKKLYKMYQHADSLKHVKVIAWDLMRTYFENELPMLLGLLRTKELTLVANHHDLADHEIGPEVLNTTHTTLCNTDTRDYEEIKRRVTFISQKKDGSRKLGINYNYQSNSPYNNIYAQVIMDTNLNSSYEAIMGLKGLETMARSNQHYKDIEDRKLYITETKLKIKELEKANQTITGEINSIDLKNLSELSIEFIQEGKIELQKNALEAARLKETLLNSRSKLSSKSNYSIQNIELSNRMVRIVESTIASYMTKNNMPTTDKLNVLDISPGLEAIVSRIFAEEMAAFGRRHINVFAGKETDAELIKAKKDKKEIIDKLTRQLKPALISYFDAKLNYSGTAEGIKEQQCFKLDKLIEEEENYIEYQKQNEDYRKNNEYKEMPEATEEYLKQQLARNVYGTREHKEVVNLLTKDSVTFEEFIDRVLVDLEFITTHYVLSLEYRAIQAPVNYEKFNELAATIQGVIAVANTHKDEAMSQEEKEESYNEKQQELKEQAAEWETSNVAARDKELTRLKEQATFTSPLSRH